MTKKEFLNRLQQDLQTALPDEDTSWPAWLLRVEDYACETYMACRKTQTPAKD